MKIIIKHLLSTYNINVHISDTLEDIKDKINKILNIEPKNQILIYNDRKLTENYKRLVELDIKDNAVILLKKKKITNMDFNKFKEESSVSSKKNMPNINMSNMSMTNIMKMFPKLKDEFDNYPQFKAMLNNPSLQEDMMNMSSNSDYMKEQMRNYDVALARMENMPEGFNLINSMFKDTPDPTLLFDNTTYKEGESINSTISKPLPGDNKKNLLYEYREEMALLREMGFTDSRANLKALVNCNGDIEKTIETLNKE